MQTKPVAFAIALLALSLPGFLCAQQAVPKEISSLLADYRKEFGKAKEPGDKVLRAEATKIAATLVAGGNADGAKDISTQVEDKIAGKTVTATDTALANLFSRYDNALVAAAKPVRDKYTSRVDALLKGNMSKDLNAVVALGEAKKVILGEIPAFESTTAPKLGGSMITNPARGRKVLTDLVEGKTWALNSAAGEELWSFERRGNKARWFRPGGNSPGISEYPWSAEDDCIQVGTNLFDIRFDVSGSFGELLSHSTKNRYRMEPSTKKIPGK